MLVLRPISLLWLLVATRAAAQDHSHSSGMHPDAPTPQRASGQSAFAAIAETVGLLTADSSTDWSKVDIEALRQHLIDMDDVMMRARVMATPVEGGVRLTVMGSGRVLEAIHRMVGAHAGALDAMPEYRATSTRDRDGERLVVTARNPSDQRTVARIRALGLGGLLTEGSHHPVHHLMIVRRG